MMNERKHPLGFILGPVGRIIGSANMLSSCLWTSVTGRYGDGGSGAAAPEEEVAEEYTTVPTTQQDESDRASEANSAVQSTHSHEYLQMLALGRVNMLEKQLDSATARVKELESELLEAKVHSVTVTPLDDVDIAKEGERISFEVFSTRNMRHVNTPGVSVFELEEMLEKVRVIRDEFPSTSELQNVYQTLEQELSHVNGRKLEKKQELVGELDKFLELNREVLMLEGVDSLLARTNTSNEASDEQQQSLPEFFEQAKKREQRLVVRIKALLKAHHDTEALQENTNQLSLQNGSALEAYFNEITEKLIADQDILRAKRAEFKSQWCNTLNEIQRHKVELRSEREELAERIKTTRMQLDRDVQRWMQVCVLLTDKEREEERSRRTEQRVEERLGETVAVLEGRQGDASAGASIARVQQVIEKNIKQTCGKRLDERRQALVQHIQQTHAEFYTLCRTHWMRTVASHDETVDQLKELNRLLQSESAALRTQRKQSADGGILKLQEALCEQRLKLVNEKKSEVYRLKKELESISKQLDTINTIQVLKGAPKYAAVVAEDFRDLFIKSQRLLEPLERIEEIHDLLLLVCDVKSGVMCASSKDTESLEALMNCLDTLEYKGVIQEVRGLLETRADIKSSLQLMCNIIDQHSKHQSSTYMDKVVVGGKPLRRCLGSIRSKLLVLFDDPGQCPSDSPAAAEYH